MFELGTAHVCGQTATGGDEKLGNSKAVIEKWGKYKEVQIHGEVDLKNHVARLVANERHRSRKNRTAVLRKADFSAVKLVVEIS